MTTTPSRLLRLAPPAATDRDLLRAHLGGDDAAFEELARRHAGLARRAADEVCPAAADDAAQATLVLLARKAASVAGRESAAGWVFETARRLALKARTAATRRAAREAASIPPAPPADPLDSLTLREIRGAVAEELARLPDELRLPLVLCYWDGASRAAAAARLGCSASTLRRRMDAGRDRLAARLARRGFTGPALLAALSAVQATGQAGCHSAASPAVEPLTEGAAALLRGGGGAAASKLLAVSAVLVAAVGLALGFAPGVPSSADPPARPASAVPNAAGVDAFGDPLPPGAVARLGSVRFRNGMWTNYVLLSPDGARLATIGTGGREHGATLTVWDADGRPVRTVPVGGPQVEFARWMPDGRGFALLKLGTADYAVWEFTDEKAAPPAVVDRNKVNHVFVGTFAASTVSPDGKLAAGASRTAERVTPDRLEVWAVTPGTLLRAAPARFTVDTTDGFVWLGFTPDSKRLVGVTRHQEPDRPVAAGVPGQPLGAIPGAKAETATAYVWDAASGKELRTFTVPGGAKRIYAPAPERNYAVSPDGDTLFAAGEKGRVAAFDLATGKERFAVQAADLPKDKPWEYLGELAVSPDGRTLLVVEKNQAVAALDAATGKRLWRSNEYEAKQVYAVTCLPDGKRFVIGGVDGGIVFGDMATGKITPMPGYRRWFDAVAIDDAGKVAVTAGRDGIFRRWDVATGRELGKVALADFDAISALAFSPDRKLVAGVGWGKEPRGVPIVVDVATGRVVARPKGEAQHMIRAGIYGGRPAAWHPDGSVLLVDADCGVRFGADGTKVRTYTTKEIKEGSDAHSVAVSPDGKRVALAGWGPRTHPIPGWVAVFDAETGALIRAGHTPHSLECVAFTPDGSVAVSGGVYPPDPRFGPSVAESTTAAVALFDPASGKFHHPFANPTDGKQYRGATNLTVSPTGYQFAITEHDDSITVYELASGAVRHRLRGHRNQVFQLAFTPDGSRLVSVSWDGTGLVWDVAPPRPATPPATEAERLKRWEALLAADGAAAHKIMGELAADPAAMVALLKVHLKPTTATDAEIDKSIAGLGSDDFAEREAATTGLDRLGAAAVPRAKARQAKEESAEVRRRLGEFLARHDRPDRLTGPRLRERRAVELLEAAGTADARALLDDLARPASTPLARDAAAAAGRLRER